MSYLSDDSRAFRQWRRRCVGESRPPLVWWRPPFGQVVRQMRWGWVLLVPLAFGLALLIAGLVWGGADAAGFWVGLKLLLLTILAPVATWEHLRHKAIRGRADLFCIHCGWTLRGLPDEGNCPECGRTYSMRVVQMFRQDPQWVIAYWRSSGKPPGGEEFDAQHQVEPREQLGGDSQNALQIAKCKLQKSNCKSQIEGAEPSSRI